MLKRLSSGHSPQLTFTSDFHELVQGDLIPGPCVVRYDPFRIVPKKIVSGSSWLPGKLTMEVIFHPQGMHWSNQFNVQSGRALEVLPNIVGQGNMCKTDFEIPEGCEELECWFHYIDESGNQYWDSNQGKNYWLRFPTHDLPALSADVTQDPKDATDALNVQVFSVPEVGSIAIRWRATQQQSGPRRTSPMTSTGINEEGKKMWAPADRIGVPHLAAVAFDLVYTVGGRLFTDDNEGNWYIAH